MSPWRMSPRRKGGSRMQARVIAIGFLAFVAAVGCSSAENDKQQDVLVKPKTGATNPASLAGGGYVSSNRYVVVFKSATLPSDATATITNAGGIVRQAQSQIGVATIEADATTAATLAA